jgi:hypothetical protein
MLMVAALMALVPTADAALSDRPVIVPDGGVSAPTPVHPPSNSPINNVARDCGHSAELQDGRTLWIYCDTTNAQLSYFVANTAAVSYPGSPTVMHERLTPVASPYSFLEPVNDPCPRPGDVPAIWPTTATVVPYSGADRVIVYFETICRQPGNTIADVTSGGIGVAQLWVNVGQNIEDFPIRGTILASQLWNVPAPMWGSGAVYGNDNFVYVYKCRSVWGEAQWGCKVARVAPANVANLGSYQFFTGSGWSSNEGQAVYMDSPGQATPGVAHEVQYLADSDLFARAYVTWPGIGSKIAVQYADNPWGPWSAALESPLPDCGDPNWCYAGGLSTALTNGDQVGFVYFDPSVPFPNRPTIGQMRTVSRRLQAGRPFGSFDVADWYQGNLRIAGWATDPEGVGDSINVEVRVDGALQGVFTASRIRSDVAAVYPSHGSRHGFDISLPISGNQVCIKAINVGSGVDRSLGCRTVHIVDARPFGSVDVVSRVSNGVRVAGWAVDADVPNQPIDVHVYVDGAGVASWSAGQRRDDVAAVVGMGAFHGFDSVIPMAPGTHQVCVFAINDYAPGGHTLMQCRSVTVGDSSPFGSLDIAAKDGAGIRVAGWTIDQDTPSTGIGMHVYVDGVGTGAFTANRRRDDVGAAFGLGVFHGFDETVSATPGTHQVCVFGINSYVHGPNTLIACRSVTV